MDYKKNSAAAKWVVIGAICLQSFLVGSGCSNGSEEAKEVETRAGTIHANKANDMEQLRVLVLTGGHDFDNAPFYNSTVTSSSALFRAKGRHLLLATPC